MDKSEKEGKFVEAEIAKQRIAQLKMVEDKQMYDEIKKKQEQERIDLEKSQKEELSAYNVKKDQELFTMNNQFQELLKQMDEKHEEELNKFVEKYKANEEKIAKPSGELLEKNKQLELYVKKKE